MSIILSFYTKEAYKEYLLPAANNTDWAIGLSKNNFHLAGDLTLKLESVHGGWRFKRSRKYGLVNEKKDPYSFLRADDIIQITTRQNETVTAVVTETKEIFPVFDKYDISRLDEITIGASGDNLICYRFLDLVSRKHAVLKRVGNQWSIEDISSNGVFLNEKKLIKPMILEPDDCINIYGLKIIYLSDKLALSAFNQNIKLDGRILPLHYIEGEHSGKKAPEITPKEKKYFHRSPRNFKPLDTEPVEIEAPPAPKRMQKKPLFMIIGPSFTMAIPMLLGTLLAMYSSRISGATSSAFMYTGIITAVGSAVLGVFWAIVNIRYEKRITVEEEKHRFEAYSHYLVKKVEEIKEKYQKSQDTLSELYPPAGQCVKYRKASPYLWSRNRMHEDFLVHRLGLGSLPFQIDIEVPKEKFTLLEDRLNEKPLMIKKEYETLYEAPVCVDLGKHHLIGLIGGQGKKGALDVIHALSAQIGANNCYTDVKLIYIYNGNEDPEQWEFAKWLPHVWSEDKKTRYVASCKEEASDVFFELVKIFRTRSEEENKKGQLKKPYYIMFVADPSVLEGELITKYIYEQQENLGLTVIITAESYEKLPNLCEYVIQLDLDFKGCYSLTGGERRAVEFDTVTDYELEEMARSLAGVEVKEVEKGGDIPLSLTFFDMYQVNSPEELGAEERWRKNRNYENMRAAVGMKAGGEPCYLDIHEKYHGPHGLVAGTTGSGKSETLQTYMLSLALNFSPDDVNFFVIDYKGGGMANLFEGLPHLIGQISNLSGNQVARAMVSIKSENKRRQRIFNENNVNNINLYTKLYKNGEASIPVPHLLIIIDEFAELKREESDFMKELISVAQVGRSLGVHLILATQKPSGTVDDNIWSNSKFRLCLRVQDRQDSNDMLHKPDAAYITQAGRCYLQVGNDELYELFQSAYSGAVYDDEKAQKAELASMISLNGKEALIGSNLKRKQKAKRRFTWIYNLIQIMKQCAADQNMSVEELAHDPDRMKLVYEKLEHFEVDYPENDYNTRRLDELLQLYAAMSALVNEEEEKTTEEEVTELLKYVDDNNIRLPEQKLKTQLDAVVEYLARTAGEQGYCHTFQLWLPLLPSKLLLESLEGFSEHSFGKTGFWEQPEGEWRLKVPLGLCDDPVSQAQMPLMIDFSENGHHAFCGMIVSGKSTLLQTLVYALIELYPPDYLNIYAIDFSSRMLSAFENAPHVGGIVYEDDVEKINKFFNMMEGMLVDRKKLLKGGNYSQYVRANGVVIPSVLVVIDNYSSFREKTDNRYEDMLIHIAHDGVGYGIFLAITAGGFGTAEIQARIGDNIKSVVCLQMNDKFQYTDAMRMTHLETMPEANIKGRGLTAAGERVLEFQTALALEAADDYERIEKIKAVCSAMDESWKGKRAKQIPVIPNNPIWAEYEKLEEVKSMLEDDRHLPDGYDKKSAAVHGIDLSRTYCYLISGRVRTGKTNYMKALIYAAAQKGGRLCIIEYVTEELVSIAEETNAQYINSQRDQGLYFQVLIDVFKSRKEIKRRLIAEGKEDSVYEELSAQEKYYIFIADLVSFIQAVYKPEEGVINIRAFLENISEKGREHNVFFFASINPDQAVSILGVKAYENMAGYKTGIHFGGNTSNIRYMDFGYLSYTEQNKIQKPGMGMIPSGNEDYAESIVVPLVKGRRQNDIG